MTAGETAPIAAAEADAALECLTSFDDVVLAVSGGPDSMALLVLAAEWLGRLGAGQRPRVVVATVDHRLRDASRDEANLVADESRRLGFEHTTLPWSETKPASGILAAARDARYRLLESFALGLSKGCPIAVVTAHHRDDQAETVLMHLARGAGVDGLSAIARIRPIRDGSPVSLIRPLLDFSKARLRATVESRGVSCVADPTNADTRFERPRLRSAVAALEDLGLTSKTLALTARRMDDAKQALAYASEAFGASINLSYGHGVFASLNRNAFAAGPAYLRQKVLERLIRQYGGATAPPDLAEIEALARKLAERQSMAATLGGAVISAGPRSIRIWRELGRLDGADVPLTPGIDHVWDQRFIVRLGSATRGDMTVRPLGANAYLSIRGGLDRGHPIPARAAHALPAFWAGFELIAVPSLAPFAKSDVFPFDCKGIEVEPIFSPGAK